MTQYYELKHFCSILSSIKKLLGISEEYKSFDPDIIIHINSALSILIQLGIGPPNGFSIEDDKATWFDFIGEDSRLDSVKSYVYLKVKLLFDPPLNSAVIESLKQTIKELEWRLNVSAEST